jgi:uncharacterized protein (TIGR02145 family)
VKLKLLVCAVVVVVFGGITAIAQNASSFTDKRDGKAYRTVRIGNQTWMSENLNYQTGDTWCYENNADNCKKYGRLYTWDAAMKACPAGWHLPTRQEWNELVSFAGGDNAGTKLKSGSPDWNGTNESGFSALPGGFRYYDGTFSDLGALGYWWTATEYDASNAYYRYMSTGYTGVGGGNNYKSYGFSARCVQD